MEEEDVSAVVEIENLSYPNPWREMTFRGELYNQPVSFPFVMVHKYQRRIIGYVIFWCIKERAMINNIAVHPDFRRMGVAEAVMRQVLDQIKKAGANLVTLEVRPSNAAARSLYKKLDFEVLGVKANYYHNPPEDALIMGKFLS
ncbi:MAG: ribosomal protein S18-alanine N-acetyltransferase [Candidatus Aminicenantes bacterium]|nr:MAG: ribosomal protein S18-alanine N-acetyltransferase [Candidatus Aminicenantes bacterium]